MNLVILVFVSQGNLPSDVIKVTGKGTPLKRSLIVRFPASMVICFLVYNSKGSILACLLSRNCLNVKYSPGILQFKFSVLIARSILFSSTLGM